MITTISTRHCFLRAFSSATSGKVGRITRAVVGGSGLNKNGLNNNNGRQVLLIGAHGEKLGIKTVHDAMLLTQSTPNATLKQVGMTSYPEKPDINLPVCRIMLPEIAVDDDRVTKERTKDRSDKPLSVSVKGPLKEKQIRLKSAIGEHDLQVKITQMRDLLEKRTCRLRILLIQDRAPRFSLYKPKLNNEILVRVQEALMTSCGARVYMPVQQQNDVTSVLGMQPKLSPTTTSEKKHVDNK